MTPFTLFAEPAVGTYGLAALAAFGLVGVTLLILAWAAGRLAAMPRADAAAGPVVPAARPLVVRLRDPGTAGRPRPRAPAQSHAPA